MIPLKDISGLKFKRFTVVKKSNKKYRGCALWICKCECGNIRHIAGSVLRAGIYKGCGCEKKKDINGMKFGNWTVIRKSKKNKNKILWWVCKCKCGTIKTVSGNSLRMNSTKSCGCLKLKYLREKGEPDREKALFKSLYQKIIRINRRYNTRTDISFDKFKLLSKLNCFYCNIPPSNSYKDKPLKNKKEITILNYSGLDQVIPRKGYVMNNVVPCCINCNRVKHVLSQDEFRKLVINIYNNWAKYLIKNTLILLLLHNEIIGKKLGKLTVIKKNSKNPNKGSEWLCKCSCGGSLILNTTQIRRENGRITSCGCEKNLNSAFNNKKFVIIKRLYDSQIKRNEKTKKYNIIGIDEFYKLSFGNCFYCGTQPSRRVIREEYIYKKNKKKSEFIYVNGVDRIDSSKGYIKGNVRSCCSSCNIAKNSLSEDKFRKLIIDIYNHWACN